MPDPAKIGQLAAWLMDDLEERYGPDAELGDVLIALEVRDPETGETGLEHRCSSERAVVGAGLAALIFESMTSGSRVEDDDE